MGKKARHESNARPKRTIGFISMCLLFCFLLRLYIMAGSEHSTRRVQQKKDRFFCLTHCPAVWHRQRHMCERMSTLEHTRAGHCELLVPCINRKMLKVVQTSCDFAFNLLFFCTRTKNTLKSLAPSKALKWRASTQVLQTIVSDAGPDCSLPAALGAGVDEDLEVLKDPQRPHRPVRRCSDGRRKAVEGLVHPCGSRPWVPLAHCPNRHMLQEMQLRLRRHPPPSSS